MGPIKIIWSIEFSQYSIFPYRALFGPSKTHFWFGVGFPDRYGNPKWYQTFQGLGLCVLFYRHKWQCHGFYWYVFKIEWHFLISGLFAKFRSYSTGDVGNIIARWSKRTFYPFCLFVAFWGRWGKARSSLLHSAFVVQHFVSSAVLEMNASPSSGKYKIRPGPFRLTRPETPGQIKRDTECKPSFRSCYDLLEMTVKLKMKQPCPQSDSVQTSWAQWTNVRPSMVSVNYLKNRKNEKMWTLRKGKAPCCINWPSVIEDDLVEHLKKTWRSRKKCLKTTSEEKTTKKNSRRK